MFFSFLAVVACAPLLGWSSEAPAPAGGRLSFLRGNHPTRCHTVVASVAPAATRRLIVVIFLLFWLLWLVSPFLAGPPRHRSRQGVDVASVAPAAARRLIVVFARDR